MHDARRRRAVAAHVAELHLFTFDHRVLQRIEMLRRLASRCGPTPSFGSTTTAVDAACASARNGSGSARTSLRNAALSSGDVGDGPGDEEQGAGLGRVQTAEIGAGAAEQFPPTVTPGL